MVKLHCIDDSCACDATHLSLAVSDGGVIYGSVFCAEHEEEGNEYASYGASYEHSVVFRDILLTVLER